jgi:hypothetical protein
MVLGALGFLWIAVLAHFDVFLDDRAWAQGSFSSDTIQCCSSSVIEQCPCDSPLVPESVHFKVEYSTLACTKYRCRWVPEIESLLDQAQVVVRGPSADCQQVFTDSPEPVTTPAALSAPVLPPVPTTGEGILSDVSTFPEKCGYQWQGFSIQKFEANMKYLLSSEPPSVKCAGFPNMCTSASYLAFLMKLRKLKEAGRIQPEQLQTAASIRSTQWISWNARTLPGEAISKMKDVDGKPLGVSKSLSRQDLPQKEWPKPGDFVQLWRKSGSGHSFVFEGYLKDKDGRSIALCYWTANPPTGGFGRMCEPLTVVQTINIGRFTQ